MSKDSWTTNDVKAVRFDGDIEKFLSDQRNVADFKKAFDGDIKAQLALPDWVRHGLNKIRKQIKKGKRNAAK